MVKGIDVFRLFMVIELNSKISIPYEIRRDMMVFLEKMLDEPDNLKTLGTKTINKNEVLEENSCYF